MLLHVIDSSSPNMDEQIEAVESVLKEIGADAPILHVYNKIDLSGDAAKTSTKPPMFQIEFMSQLIQDRDLNY